MNRITDRHIHLLDECNAAINEIAADLAALPSSLHETEEDKAKGTSQFEELGERYGSGKSLDDRTEMERRQRLAKREALLQEMDRIRAAKKQLLGVD